MGLVRWFQIPYSDPREDHGGGLRSLNPDIIGLRRNGSVLIMIGGTGLLLLLAIAI